jgi:hypothetical protein
VTGVVRNGVIAALLLLALTPAAQGAPRSVPQGFYGAVWDREVVDAPPAVQDAQWARMASAGVESVRAVFSWSDAQPDPLRPPSFESTDQLVALASAHGIRLLPVVIYAPPWARKFPGRGASPPARPGDYAAYLRALVARYGPTGSFWTERPDLPRRPLREWQIWNEPQLRYQWDDGEYASDYGRLLRAAHAALRRADPGAKVVLAGATNLAWEALATLYRSGRIAGSFDVATLHPYTASPDRVIRAARLFRAELRRHGDGRTPLWITELGWPASSGRVRSNSTLQTTDRGMADRLERAYALLARTRRSGEVGVSRAYWYTWASPYRGGDIFGFAGLLRFDGGAFSARPAYDAYVASARRHEGCAKDGAGRCQ